VPEKPFFAPRELAALVGTFREAGFSKQQRLAVLYRTDPHHGARMFAFIGTLRGWTVRAFKEFETALNWLSQEDESQPVAGEQRVPIQRDKRRIEVTSAPRKT
jgi:hypothetical protein